MFVTWKENFLLGFKKLDVYCSAKNKKKGTGAGKVSIVQCSCFFYEGT